MPKGNKKIVEGEINLFIITQFFTLFRIFKNCVA